LSQPALVVHGLVRAASAFLSRLARRSAESAVVQAPHAVPVNISSGSVSVPIASGPISSVRRTTAGVENRCPVCQVRFRGSRICSRCGADLEPLMVLTVKAWQLRQAARQALEAGEPERALELVSEAQGTQNTGGGEALRLLAVWLKTAAPSSYAAPPSVFSTAGSANGSIVRRFRTL
jgi:hypothetical protein